MLYYIITYYVILYYIVQIVLYLFITLLYDRARRAAAPRRVRRGFALRRRPLPGNRAARAGGPQGDPLI